MRTTTVCGSSPIDDAHIVKHNNLCTLTYIVGALYTSNLCILSAYVLVVAVDKERRELFPLVGRRYMTWKRARKIRGDVQIMHPLFHVRILRSYFTSVSIVIAATA